MAKEREGTIRSAFCVWNNPRETLIYKHDERGEKVRGADGAFVVLERVPTPFYHMSELEICETVVNMWCNTKEGRTAACTYCISAAGLHHLHMIFECSREDKFRYSTIQKLLGVKCHIEMTRGNKDDAEDYINKWGKYEEKGELVIAKYQHGEIKGAQGNRKDINQYAEMIESGMTPQQIMRENFAARKYEKMLKDAYFDYRNQRTPYMRDIKVIWHVGDTGTGKSYECRKKDALNPGQSYYLTDYENGGLDMYNGEPILVLEEFRGQLKYNTLLLMLDKYKSSFHARYTNAVGLWNEVHITSPLFPDEVYKLDGLDKNDKLEQFMRRITEVNYHFKHDGGYYKYRFGDILERYQYRKMENEGLRDEIDKNFWQRVIDEDFGKDILLTSENDGDIIKKTPLELGLISSGVK